MDLDNDNPDYVYDDDDGYSDDDEDVIMANIDEEDADLFFGIDGGDAENEPDSGQTNNDGDDNDDDSKGGPVKLDQKKHHTLGVVKSSFSALIKIRNKNHKTIFIDTIQKFVLRNTEIAARCGMIMHHVVMNCVDAGIVNPPVFGNEKFVNAALNYNQPIASDLFGGELLIAAKEAYNIAFTPCYEEMHGRPWLLGYLANTYHGNIISSTKSKWNKAVINESIEAFGLIHLRNIGSQARRRIKKEIRRQLFNPGSDVPNNAPQLNHNAHELITFHRQGFLLQDNQVLNQQYINFSKENFHFFILHYGHCLRRQDNLERAWNETHLPRDHIRLKKRMPLPFFRKQQRKSVKIDKKGLYFILSEYRKSVRTSEKNPNPNFQFPRKAPKFPTKAGNFNRELFGKWMRFLFRIDKVLDGTKQMRRMGVAMYTNAVCASILYPKDPDEDKELLDSIRYLSLLPLHDDRVDDEVLSSCESISHYENEQIWEDLRMLNPAFNRDGNVPCHLFIVRL